MTRDAIPVLAFWAGALLFVWAPTVWRRLMAWWRPEPLAPYRYPGGDR